MGVSNERGEGVPILKMQHRVEMTLCWSGESELPTDLRAMSQKSTMPRTEVVDIMPDARWHLALSSHSLQEAPMSALR
jgi:hypothetical protein